MSTVLDLLRLRLPASAGDPHAVASALADRLAERLGQRLTDAEPTTLAALRLRVHLPGGLSTDELAEYIADAVAEALP